jgi:Spy/CpxP family protein refolding chaperone
MRHRIVILAGLAAAGLWAASGGAQAGPPPALTARPMMDDGATRAIAALMSTDGLSDDQHEELRSMLDSGRSGVEPILEQLRTANETLVDQLLAADPPSADALSASVERITGLRKQLLQHQVQTVQSLREVLTPEQLRQEVQRNAGGTDDVVFLRR